MIPKNQILHAFRPVHNNGGNSIEWSRLTHCQYTVCQQQYVNILWHQQGSLVELCSWRYNMDQHHELHQETNHQSYPKSMPLQTKASHQSITKRLSLPNDLLHPNTQRENLVHTDATEQQSVLWWLQPKTSDQCLAHTHQNKCPTNLRRQLAFHHRTIHGPSHLTNVSVPNLQRKTQRVDIEYPLKQKLGQLKIPLCGRLSYKEGG